MNVIFVYSLSLIIILKFLCNGNFTDEFPKKSLKVGKEIKKSYLSIAETNRALRNDKVYTSRYAMRHKRDNGKENKTDPGGLGITVPNEMENISGVNNSNSDKHALLISEFMQLWPVQEWRKYGYFSDDYLDLINEHWLHFPPPSATLQKFLGGIYLIFSTVGCWGNVIVLFMYLR